MLHEVFCKPISFVHGKVPRCAVTIAIMGLCLISNSRTLWAQETRRLHFDEFLMEATFRIEGKGSQGTAFIIRRPIPDRSNQWLNILITADHVLENMSGDRAILQLRQRTDAGEWESKATPLPIRSGVQPLWTKHPDADVAVMYIRRPKEATVAAVPMDKLATDEDLAKYEIHPGDELRSLGFPLGYQSNSAGFPVLRSGRIASYPLLPTKDTKTFLFDFEVFPGNSGGPVYLVDQGPRVYGEAIRTGEYFTFITGLIASKRCMWINLGQDDMKVSREDNLWD